MFNILIYSIIFSFSGTLLSTTLSAAASQNMLQHSTADFQQHLQQTYGKLAIKRAKDWQSTITGYQSAPDIDKLTLVNNFFNTHIQYLEDKPLWAVNDYWATPFETFGRGKGDCEDYSIVKFFGLIELGVPEHKLRLMYGRHLTLGQPHMVLLYFDKPDSIPLVLDNFNPEILTIDKRDDLKSIYSFNSNGLWVVGSSTKVDNSQGVSNWDNLLQRMENDQQNLNK